MQARKIAPEALASLTERLPSKQSVDGSNPSGAFTKTTPSKGEGLAAADPHSNPLKGNELQARRVQMLSRPAWPVSSARSRIP